MVIGRDARPTDFAEESAFLERLVSDGRLELTRRGKLEELAEAILGELAEHSGADPVRTIVVCLEEHEAVAELYADDDELRAALVPRG